MIDKFKGFFLVLLVVLLSAVFALQFGGGQAEGCAAGGSTYLARVYDQTLSRGDFEAAYAVANFGRLPEETQRSMRLPELVLDGLIDRTLLAREARRVGFDVGQEEVMTRFVNDGIILLSLGVGAPPMLPQGEIPVSFTDKEGAFNKDLAERYIQNGLRRSVGEFADAQVDEYLAAQMRELVASSVNVSEAEIWDDYVRENDNAKISYVRFSPAYYIKQKPATSEAALAAWIADNEDRLATEYETNKHRYTNLEKQVHARHILVKAGSYATDEQKAKAKKQAEALQKRAAKGEDFAALASEHSGDQITAKNGGDIGFLRKGTMPESFDDALFSMKVDEISEIVETPYGFHVIKVLAIREGDVPVDEAKRELAEALYRADWLEARAREAAATTLASWQQSKDDDAVAQLLSAAAKQKWWRVCADAEPRGDGGVRPRRHTGAGLVDRRPARCGVRVARGRRIPVDPRQARSRMGDLPSPRPAASRRGGFHRCGSRVYPRGSPDAQDERDRRPLHSAASRQGNRRQGSARSPAPEPG